MHFVAFLACWAAFATASSSPGLAFDCVQCGDSKKNVCYKDPTNLNKPSCWCEAGKTGDQCQSETPVICLVSGQACASGGYCVSMGTDSNQTQCKCDPGFTGELCQTSICANFSCGNGTCNPGNGVPFCQCNVGYYGLKCETDTNVCPKCPAGTTCDIFNPGTQQIPRCVCSGPAGQASGADECTLNLGTRGTCKSDAFVTCVLGVNSFAGKRSDTCATYRDWGNCAKQNGCTDMLKLWCGTLFKKVDKNCGDITTICAPDANNKCDLSSYQTCVYKAKDLQCPPWWMSICATGSKCYDLANSFCQMSVNKTNCPDNLRPKECATSKNVNAELATLPGWELLYPHDLPQSAGPRRTATVITSIVAAAVCVGAVLAVVLYRRRAGASAAAEDALL